MDTHTCFDGVFGTGGRGGYIFRCTHTHEHDADTDTSDLSVI